MTSTRLLITAMVVENRPVREVAATHAVSTSWLYELLARYRREGEADFEPRSRRPETNPNATPAEVVDLLVRLRKELADQGLDAGPETICWHLAHHHPNSRCHTRDPGLHPDRQSHGVHHPPIRRQGRTQPTRDRATTPGRGPDQRPPLAPSNPGQGRTLPADHEEMAPSPTHPAGHHRRPPGPTGHLRRPVQPPTAPPVAAAGLPPPRSTPADPRPPPATAPTTPTNASAATASTRQGKITLRHGGTLYSIGIGRTHARTRVIVLVQDLDIRIIDATTGELIRELTLDTTKRYQSTGRPPGPTR